MITYQIVNDRQVKSKKRKTKAKTKAKTPDARKDATDAILNNTNQANTEEPDDVSEYTEDELPRLDFLFDAISWLIHLYSGNVELMNESASHIDLPAVEADQLNELKSKLDSKVKQLIEKVEGIVDSPEPVSQEEISDIENELRSYY